MDLDLEKEVEEEIIRRKKESKDKKEEDKKEREAKTPETKPTEITLSPKSTEITLFPSIEVIQKPEVKLAEISSELKIEKELWTQISIPKLQILEKPKLSILKIESEIKLRQKYQKIVELPKLSFDIKQNVKIKSLDSEIKISQKPKTEERLPELNLAQKPKISLNLNYELIKPSIEAISKLGGQMLPLEQEAEKLELELEKLDLDLFKSEGSGKIQDSGAIIILSSSKDPKYSCIDLVQEICRRFLREKGESTKEVAIISDPKSMRKYSVYDYSIFVIKEGEKISELEKEIRNKIQEFKKYARTYFIINSEESRAKDVYDAIYETKDKFFYNLFKLKLKDLSLDRFAEISKLLFGYLEPIGGESVDKIFGDTSETYYQKLEDIYRKIKKEWNKYPIVKIGKNESKEHYLMKHFVVMSLVDSGLGKDEISTQENLGEIIADVYVRSSRLAIEIETLFGRGEFPIDSLRQELIDYPWDKIGELWVVMENFTIYLHLKELIGLRNWLRKGLGKNVEFYALNLSELRLVPILEFAKNIREAFGEGSQP